MSPTKGMFKKIGFLLPRIILISIFVVYIIFAFLTYFDYFEPYLYPLKFIKGKAYNLTENIILGPYPHYEELMKLKEKYNVGIVLSLLNVNLPQEKALYEREKKNSERLGLKIMSFSMEYLPLQSDSNKRELRLLMQLVKQNKGKKIYIHCYLGKHRIGFVRQGLIDEGFVSEKPSEKRSR